MTETYDRQMDRAIGGLEAHRDATDARLKSIEDKIDTLVEQMAKAEGGVKMLISVGMISATLGALVSHLAEWFISHVK